MKKIQDWMKLAGVAIASSVLAVALYAWLAPKPYQTIDQRQQAYPARYTAFTAAAEGTPMPDFTAPAALGLPAVVHIKTRVEAPTAQAQPRQGPQGQGLDLFRDFFGDRGFDMRQGPRESSGSGVIITPDGYIVTNNHVVDDADKVTVVLDDKRTYTGTVVGTDRTTDLAVIKIDEKNLPFLAYGNSDAVKVGQWVLAVGNPFELTSTVTAGIVSARGRRAGVIRDSLSIENFIQTDAAVNPGNSGGALISTDGKLIGINTAIATQTGAYSGYSFAIPSALAKKVVEDILNYGEVQRGFLGVSINDVEGAKLQNQYKGTLNQGVYIGAVNEGSAGKEAGILVGDVIVAVDGSATKSASELLEQIGRHRPGDKVSLRIVREGKELTLTAVLKSKSGKVTLAKRDDTTGSRQLGAELKDLTSDEKTKLKLEGGVKVESLLPGRMRSAGIREGFIITSVNDQPVKVPADVTRIIEQRIKDKRSGAMLEGVYPDGRSALYTILF